jgi:hypothetical protein
MMIVFLSILLMISCSGAVGMGFGSNSMPVVYSESSDTTENVDPQYSPRPPHWLNVDLMLGRQSLGNTWAPYSMATGVAMSIQRRLDRSSLWLTGSIIVAWAGELDAEGVRAGPGTSFVELHNGLGHWWYFERLPFSCYAGGGLTYIWAKLELPDESKPPLPISEFLGRPIYPDMEEPGNFFGGYLRGGIVFHTGGKWYVGIGALGTLTTNQTILGRTLNINSTIIGFFIGAGD